MKPKSCSFCLNYLFVLCVAWGFPRLHHLLLSYDSTVWTRGIGHELFFYFLFSIWFVGGYCSPSCSNVAFLFSPSVSLSLVFLSIFRWLQEIDLGIALNHILRPWGESAYITALYEAVFGLLFPVPRSRTVYYKNWHTTSMFVCMDCSLCYLSCSLW